MTTKQAIRHFGSTLKLAMALRIERQAIYQWGDSPPLLRQYQIEKLTNGKLKVSSNG